MKGQQYGCTNAKHLHQQKQRESFTMMQMYDLNASGQAYVTQTREGEPRRCRCGPQDVSLALCDACREHDGLMASRNERVVHVRNDLTYAADAIGREIGNDVQDTYHSD
jgi:hypothetical protein